MGQYIYKLSYIESTFLCYYICVITVCVDINAKCNNGLTAFCVITFYKNQEWLILLIISLYLWSTLAIMGDYIYKLSYNESTLLCYYILRRDQLTQNALTPKGRNRFITFCVVIIFRINCHKAYGTVTSFLMKNVFLCKSILWIIILQY